MVIVRVCAGNLAPDQYKSTNNEHDAALRMFFIDRPEGAAPLASVPTVNARIEAERRGLRLVVE